MKKVIYLSSFYIVFFFASCKKDFLDVQSQTKVTDALAYTSLTAIKALTSSLYQNMPTEDLKFVVYDEASFPSEYTDEAVRSYTWGSSVNDPILRSGIYTWWNYGAVRDVNDFIAKIPGASGVGVDDAAKKRFLAEAKFIRAFYYFSMVKRYGGIPIIKEVQDPNAPIETLKVSRNTEQEVYDFIGAELDTAIAGLPEKYDGDGLYRATKYAALALKSRAMLYAASIAKYGTVQLNGLAGIPSGEANKYWQAAYDAAQTIINSGQFGLYNSNPDPVANFQEYFLNSNQFLNGLGGSNSESIFVQVYSYPSRTHSFDFYNAPQSFKIDYGCVTNPTLELVEDFEYKDGSPGKLKVNDALGNPILYTNPADLFADKDPRFKASIMYPNMPWQGSYVELRRGIIDGGQKITATALSTNYPSDTDPNKITVIGKDGPTTVNDPTKTGFYVKKFMDPVNRVAQDHSTTPWVVFRYGEVLLNYAEAAVELGKTGDAFTAIKQIRDRAGIVTPFTSGSITRDIVRHERRVEMAFENQRWWDLRRWRIADQVLNSTQFHALWPWLMWEPSTSPSNMKYTFEIVNAPKNARTFPTKLYYEPIPDGEITKNSNLIQNPGY